MSAVGATDVQAIIIARKSWVMGHVGHVGQFSDGSWVRWVMDHKM